MTQRDWHAMEVTEVTRQFAVDPSQGLDEAEAKARLNCHRVPARRIGFRQIHGCRCPGRSSDSGRPASGDDDYAGDWGCAYGQATGDHSQAAGSRNLGQYHGYLLGQNRHTD